MVLESVLQYELNCEEMDLQHTGLKKKNILRKSNQKVCNRNVDVFITSKMTFKEQLKHCENKLSSGETDIYLHCVGKAIIRGINLALTLIKKSNNKLTYAINTSTVQFIDELHPLSDESEILFNERHNSAVHIKISRAAGTVISF